MKQYKIVISKRALRFIEIQPKKRQIQLFAAIYKLPHEGDTKQLANRPGVYRLRVGTYRVIYTIHENILTVEVLNAGNRGDVYK